MLKVVKKREKAIQASLENYYALMSRMLELRSGLIEQGWSQENIRTRDTKLRTIWRTFGSAWRNKGQVMREQRRDAWEAYRSERSACGVYGEDDPEAGGLTADSQY